MTFAIRLAAYTLIVIALAWMSMEHRGQGAQDYGTAPHAGGVNWRLGTPPPVIATATATSTPTVTPTPTATLTATPVSTATPDGESSFANQVANVATGSTFYLGAGGGGGTATEEKVFWVTDRGLSSCRIRAALTAAPGAGKQWALSLTYENTTFASTDDCGSHAGYEAMDLGTISDSDRSRDATVSLTGGAAANSCLQFVATPSGSPALTSGNVTITCSDGTEGVSVFDNADATNFVNTVYAGPSVPASSASHDVFWIAPRGLTTCSGFTSVDVAPGAGGEWDVQVYKSTAALTPSTNCTDLGYSTTSTLCSIAGATDENCSFGSTTVSIPAGYCFTTKILETGDNTGSQGVNTILSCSPSAAPAGAAIFATVDSTNRTSDVFCGGNNICNPTADNHQIFWITDYAIATLNGGISLVNALSITGGGLEIKIRHSNATRGASQDCSAAIAAGSTDVILGPIASGNKSLLFDNVPAAIPAGACMALFLDFSGTVSTGTGGHAFTVEGVR